jgi:hypothetical protein
VNGLHTIAPNLKDTRQSQLQSTGLNRTLLCVRRPSQCSAGSLSRLHTRLSDALVLDEKILIRQLSSPDAASLRTLANSRAGKCYTTYPGSRRNCRSYSNAVSKPEEDAIEELRWSGHGYFTTSSLSTRHRRGCASRCRVQYNRWHFQHGLAASHDRGVRTKLALTERKPLVNGWMLLPFPQYVTKCLTASAALTSLTERREVGEWEGDDEGSFPTGLTSEPWTAKPSALFLNFSRSTSFFVSALPFVTRPDPQFWTHHAIHHRSHLLQHLTPDPGQQSPLTSVCRWRPTIHIELDHITRTRQTSPYPQPRKRGMSSQKSATRTSPGKASIDVHGPRTISKSRTASDVSLLHSPQSPQYPYDPQPRTNRHSFSSKVLTQVVVQHDPIVESKPGYRKPGRRFSHGE